MVIFLEDLWISKLVLNKYLENGVGGYHCLLLHRLIIWNCCIVDNMFKKMDTILRICSKNPHRNFIMNIKSIEYE